MAAKQIQGISQAARYNAVFLDPNTSLETEYPVSFWVITTDGTLTAVEGMYCQTSAGKRMEFCEDDPNFSHYRLISR